MKLRASRTLVFSRQAEAIVGFNFLRGTAFECGPDVLGLLTLLDTWKDLDEVATLMPGMAADDLRLALDDLIAVNAILREESELATAEQHFLDSWSWGLPSALFHLSVQDRDHLSIEQTEKLQVRRLIDHPQPQLYIRHLPDDPDVVPLKRPGGDLLRLMGRRRTVRTAAADPLQLSFLGECLYAGLGITGQTCNVAGSLPLSMTPSGGARNPYEAYVYARQVEGLEPGFYHYSAMDHSLARLRARRQPLSHELLGGQEWTDAMPCIVLLCAFLERTMWKYDDANAYRVVLIEAGHIGQNIMLAATDRGLSACPTAALKHSFIQQLLELKNRATQWPIYALTLGYPGAVQ